MTTDFPLPHSLGEAIHGSLSSDLDGITYPHARSTLIKAGITTRDQLLRANPITIFKAIGEHPNPAYVYVLIQEFRTKLISEQGIEPSPWPDGNLINQVVNANSYFYSRLKDDSPVPGRDDRRTLLQILLQHRSPTIEAISNNLDTLQTIATVSSMTEGAYGQLTIAIFYFRKNRDKLSELLLSQPADK